MKILFDTNVLVSAFTIRGQTFEIIKDAVYKHDVYYTDYILSEFREVLDRKFPQLSTHTRELDLFVIKRHFIHGVSSSEVKSVSRDPDDDQVLADALINQVDLLITGDKDLLDLKNYKGIRILLPKNYWSL